MQNHYQCIHKLFEEHVAARGEATALVYLGEEISYRELDQRAQQLAHYLRALGVNTETIVALLPQRNIEMVVALLAVLKAGGAYLCLDPEYPRQRLSFILADSGAKVVLTEQSLVERLPLEIDARVVSLDLERDYIAAQGTGPIESDVKAEHLAYVTYTSGSTGAPKGTEVPHRGITGFIRGVSYAVFDEQQTFLQHSSISWDALTLELWTPLVQGGRCVLYENRILMPGELQRLVQENGINTLFLTSALFNNLVDTMPEALAGVQQLLIGGEVVSVAHVRKAMTHWPQLKIVNCYGPSECSVISSCYVINEIPGEQQRSIPIGRPVGDRKVYLLDRRLRRTAIGMSGEICVGGPAVARGYLRRPELTAERFVPDPFSKEAGGRLYRTGDLARYLAQGNLEFLGRVDQQVKVRGFRIELDEIRETLNRHPGVSKSVVIAREDEPGNKRLVGYVTAADGVELTAPELRNYLREELPEYMVPSAIMILPDLPLNVYGKVDHQALPIPEKMPRPLEGIYIPPRTEIEEKISTLWQRLLQVEKVGINDSFFDLGGHSLLLTIMFRELRQMFNTELALVDLFRYPTIGLLAEHVEQHVEPDSFELEPEFTENLKQGRSRLQGRLAQSRTAVIEVEQEQVQ
jgi:amino acid adenylation domain-containing protein